MGPRAFARLLRESLPTLGDLARAGEARGARGEPASLLLGWAGTQGKGGGASCAGACLLWNGPGTHTGIADSFKPVAPVERQIRVDVREWEAAATLW